MNFTIRSSRAVLIALTVASVAAPSVAFAGSKTRTAVGVGIAAGALGLALGAAAANAEPREERVYVRERPRCWTERRTYENRWGDLVTRRVRVCD